MVNEDLLKKMLRSPDFRARRRRPRSSSTGAIACRIRSHLLQEQVNDENARVRLQAIWGLSFFTGPDAEKAAEIAVESLVHPQDEYIKHTLDETNKTLDRRMKALKKYGGSRRSGAPADLRSRDSGRRMGRDAELISQGSIFRGFAMDRTPVCSFVRVVSAICFLAIGPLGADEPASAVGPLMKLFQSGRLPAERQGTVVEMICNRGNESDLRVVFDRIVQPEGFSAELRRRPWAGSPTPP